MSDDIKPRATLLVMRGEQVRYQMIPGSQFPKDENGNRVSQEVFEEILGSLEVQGYPLLGLTAGFLPDPEKGDRIVVLTNEAEMAVQRQQRKCEQVAADFVYSLKELVEEGLVVFSGLK